MRLILVRQSLNNKQGNRLRAIPIEEITALDEADHHFFKTVIYTRSQRIPVAYEMTDLIWWLTNSNGSPVLNLSEYEHEKKI